MNETEKVEIPAALKPKIDRYVQQKVREAKEQAEKEKASILLNSKTGAQASRVESQLNSRRLGHAYDALNAANEELPEGSRIMKKVQRTRHRYFLTIETEQDIMGEKVRNWPLGLAIGGGLFFIAMYAIYQQAFWRWVDAGYDGYILTAFVILLVVGFLYYRNKQQRTQQVAG